MSRVQSGGVKVREEPLLQQHNDRVMESTNDDPLNLYSCWRANHLDLVLPRTIVFVWQ